MPGFLVVNADDLGVSPGATLGIVRAHREGIVTSASLAPTTPHYAHAVETCVRACPSLGIGLHFTLTSGTPVAGARNVPLLVGADGRFRWRFMALLAAAGLRRNTALLQQINIELDAQFARLAHDGIRPDHVNGERHVHLIPGIFNLVVAAAAQHGVRYVRVGRDAGLRFFGAGDIVTLAANGGFAKSWLLGSLSSRDRTAIGARGLASPDHVASYLYTGRTDALLPRLLRAPPFPGVTEVMVHPGVPDANGALDLGNTELERYLMSEDRRAEMHACIAARAQQHGWTITSYRALAQRAAA